MKRQRRRRQERRRRHAQCAGWQTRHSVITGVGLAAGAALGMSSAAQGFTAYSYLTVGSTADTTGAIDCADPANTDCTLRQAFIDAKTTPHFPLVLFRSGVTGTITVGSPLEITTSLAIYGPYSPRSLTVSGNHASRVFSVTGGSVWINRLTIADGHTDGNGGGIEVKDARLSLRDTIVSGNTATGNGGGLYDSSRDDGRELYIGHSTFRDNAAARGGGIFSPAYLGTKNSGSGLYYGVYESTFSGNRANAGSGGGLYAGGTAYVTDSTISGNIAAKSGGGVSAGGGVDFVSSIAAGNSARIGPDSDSYLDAAVSLIQSSSAAIHTVPGHPNIIGQSPQLGALSYSPFGEYGGFMKPASTSPVVDQGYANGFGVDARGIGRPVDNPFVANGPGSNGSDIGAVELTLDEGPQGGSEPQGVTGSGPQGVTGPSGGVVGAVAKSKKCKKKNKKVTGKASAAKKCKKKKRSVARSVAFRGAGRHWPGGAEQHPFRLTP